MKRDMKRVTIPMSDGLVQSALKSALKNIESLMNDVSINVLSSDSKDQLNNMHFDYLGLIGIFSGNYKVTIEISEKDFNCFSSNHSVDFPNYDNLEIVDVPSREIYTIGNADNTKVIGNITEELFIKLLDLGVIITESDDEFIEGKYVANYIVRDEIFEAIIVKM